MIVFSDMVLRLRSYESKKDGWFIFKIVYFGNAEVPKLIFLM